MNDRDLSLPSVLLGGAIQGARAVVTGLIPITLIALIGWASAGSGSGNTADALRGAGLLWLAAHHVSMDLNFATTDTTGLFSMLPLGLLIIPILTLRGAGLRLAREVRGARLPVLVFAAVTLAFSYAFFVTVVAIFAGSAGVAPRYLEAFGFGLMLALVAGGSRILIVAWPEPWKRVIAYLKISLGGLLGLSAVLVITSLVLNAGAVADMLSVLRLGLLSTFFVLVASLAYLPNAAVWAMAYLSGAGFGFGLGTLIGPWGSTIGAVPTFPLFAALPAQPPRLAPLAPLLVLFVMTLAALRTHRIDQHLHLNALRLTAVVFSLSVVLAWFSGGSMVGGALSAVGPSLWKFPLVMSAHVALGFYLSVGVRVLAQRLRPRQRSKRD